MTRRSRTRWQRSQHSPDQTDKQKRAQAPWAQWSARRQRQGRARNHCKAEGWQVVAEGRGATHRLLSCDRETEFARRARFQKLREAVGSYDGQEEYAKAKGSEVTGTRDIRPKS